MKLERLEEFDPNGSQACSIHMNEIICSEEGTKHVMIKMETNGDVGCVIACEGHFHFLQRDALAEHSLTEACVSNGAIWKPEGCRA